MSGILEKTELIIGIVAPVGADFGKISDFILTNLQKFNYKVNTIKLSDYLKNNPIIKNVKIKEDTEYNRINTLMSAGDELRKVTTNTILAILAMHEIRKLRPNKEEPLKSHAHILLSLKHTEEVMTLRKIYTHGFFLIGVSSSYNNRYGFLKNRKSLTDDQIKKICKRDEDESVSYGQHTRDVFEMSDAFIDIDSNDVECQFERIFQLIFGSPHITPTKDEYAMHIAYSSSLRSSDLSRQVGAVILSSNGEIISTGANEVPKAGGGLYWPEDKEIHRDTEKGYDSNEKRKYELAEKIITKLKPELLEDSDNLDISEMKKIFADTGVFDITEYGRQVHAEMEALISCARIGISTRGCTLYSTTFPCHNCAKHIVSSGISRVVFVEPYPKSKALDLHDDSISFPHDNKDDNESGKVVFEPYVGVGHRIFVDVFSMKLSTGRQIIRKANGEKIKWKPSDSSPRLQLLPLSYIERERGIIGDISDLIVKMKLN